MAEQVSLTLVDTAWQLVGSGPNVVIATRSIGAFFAVIADGEPPISTDLDEAFEGNANAPISYAGLNASDQVWARSYSGALKVSVARS